MRSLVFRRWVRLATLTGGLALLIASCGDGSSSASPSPVSSVIPAGAPIMDQDSLTFSPPQLTVRAGETVYFQNSETSLHTVTINGKNESKNMKRSDVFPRPFTTAGTYKITCDFHPQMKATITVQ